MILNFSFFPTPDGCVKSPYAALRCILRHCGVRKVRLIPQDLRALPINFLRNRFKFDGFCRFTFIAASGPWILATAASGFAAEGGGEHGGSPMEWVWRLVNFGILVFV